VLSRDAALRFPDDASRADDQVLSGEHFLQTFDDREHRPFLKRSESFGEALDIHCPQLIKRNEPCAATEPAPWTPRVRASTGGHRCDDDSPEVVVQFVRGDDYAWPRLPNFTTERGIESNEEDVAATHGVARYRHSHSS
jgi:hypothetical protein